MDVYFYYLEYQPLKRVLPSLLEKTLARGWRAVVQVGSTIYDGSVKGQLERIREQLVEG